MTLVAAQESAMSDSARNTPRLRRSLWMRIVPRTRDFDPKEFDQCAVPFTYI